MVTIPNYNVHTCKQLGGQTGGVVTWSVVTVKMLMSEELVKKITVQPTPTSYNKNNNKQNFLSENINMIK